MKQTKRNSQQDGHAILEAAMTLLGLGITFAGSWRTGVSWMGAALLFAGVSSLLIAPDRRTFAFTCLS